MVLFHGFRGQVLRGVMSNSLLVCQGLVVGCKEGGIMVAKGMLLRQVVVLLVNACHVLCLYPRMGQVLCRWQHLLPDHIHCQEVAWRLPYGSNAWKIPQHRII